MAPVAVAPTPSAVLAAKAALSGTDTPYSTSSTAVSEAGDKSATGSPKATSATVSPVPESKSLLPGEPGYIQSLITAQQALPSTVAGETVIASGLDIVEALAVQNSTAVWVYDDAVEVGFGSRLASWDAQRLPNATGKIYPVQAREGAGLELAGYAKKAGKGKISVFASTSTLPLLAPHLETIKGDVVIHVAATEPNAALELNDALAAPGVIKALTGLSGDWDVVFSSGADVVATAAHLYGAAGRVIHVIESTFSARETTSYKFPSVGAFDEFTVSAPSDNLYLAVASAAAASITAPKIVLNTLSPEPEALFAVLAGETKRTVTVTGPTRADAEALKAVVLAILFSAPTSSSAVFPTIKAAVTPKASPAADNAKVITFYTAHGAPLPELMEHLFAASPTLTSNLAEFGSTWVNGKKSVLSLATGASTPITNSTLTDVVWVSDLNVLKHTDILATAKDGASLVLELPWAESDLSSKLTAAEIQTIQKKNIRVFLLDVDATCPYNPIREQAAFLLLYTGSQRLPMGVWKVLDAFHNGHLGRNQVEEAQAGLFEIPSADIKAWEVDAETVGKTKEAWVWDGLASAPVSFDDEEKTYLSTWEIAARHVLFREAYSVEGAKTVETDGIAGVAALAPELSEETFLVTVSENKRLTPMTYDRNVFHLEIDTAGTGLKYEIGEAIGIHGWNDAKEVDDFIKWYGLDPEAVVSLPNPAQPGTYVSRTVFQLLQQNVDLFGQPGKSFFGELAQLATKREEAMKLKFVSVPEGAELFQRLSENETVNFADVLKQFPSAHPTIQQLIELIPEIKPRHYSIASSQAAVGDKVELLIVTVDWVDTAGRTRYGQCTRYLAGLRPGDKLTVSIKPSVMKLPEDPMAPVIMAGLGTGMAPFKAFMDHRAWQRSQGVETGPMYLYFGSRYRGSEYLYGEYVEAYLAAGLLTHAGLAFSRDGPNKVYIQHKIKEDKEVLAKALIGGGYFYLCGPTWPVPDLYQALSESVAEEKGWELEQAEKFIEDLKDEERYVLEVY